MTSAMTAGSALGDVTPKETAQAERTLRRMRGELKSWLHYRRINDRVSEGRVAAKDPSRSAEQRVHGRAGEQKLAEKLHALLSEVMGPAELPQPDLSRDPDAAAKLASIAIAGKVPSEASAPTAQGVVWWVWPAVVVVGGVLFAITTAIRSRAEVLKEKERIACIEAGACTDYGFWLRLGGGALAAWIVWDKLGVRDAVTGKRSR